MVESTEYIYDVEFELIGTNGLVFEDVIEFGDFKLKSEKSEGTGIEITKILGTTTIKLGRVNYKLARELAIQKIQQDLLPLLVLTSNSGYSISNVSVKLRPTIKGDGKTWYVELSEFIGVSLKVHVFKQITKSNIESYREELKSCKHKIEKLSEEDKGNFLRAIRFWNRGKTDSDKIDKFINFYIASEILGKNLVKNEKSWVKNVCEKYGLTREYEGVKVNDIRNALVHAKYEKLSSERAEELAIKYVDKFGNEVLDLIIKFINEKSS